ncbi:MAG: M20/M25/M40 family metallo-hydrolase, partial [bacterium]
CPALNTSDATRLLVDLVRQPSVVGSSGEAAFADSLAERLTRLLPDFSIHPHPAERDLKFVFGWRRGKTRDCILFLGHYDTVALEDYGPLKKLACRPRELRAALSRTSLPPEGRRHADDDRWLWGRGTLDMKSGLVLHIMTLAAIDPADSPTLLFAFTPDEEGDSKGVKAFIPFLRQFLFDHDLRLRIILNSDFTEERGAIFTGTIGKVLVNTLVRGVPTHVSTPKAGLSAAGVAASIIPALEALDDPSPPPTCLLVRDLKAEYSVQTPDVIWSYFNFFYGRGSPASVLERTKKAVRAAVGRKLSIRVIPSPSHPASPLASHFGVFEPREEALGKVLHRWREVGVALYLSPPFYPAFVTPLNQDPAVATAVVGATKAVRSRFKVKFFTRPYYPYISDLSFFNADSKTWREFQKHCPVPLEHPLPIQTQPFTVLDIGPYGRDAHQFTERVDLHYAFEILPHFYQAFIHAVSEGFS